MDEAVVVVLRGGVAVVSILLFHWFSMMVIEGESGSMMIFHDCAKSIMVIVVGEIRGYCVSMVI